MVSNEKLVGIIIVLSLIYFVLGFLAYSGIKNKKNTWGFSFTIWFIDEDKFNKFGKRLCPFGKILFISVMATLVLMFSS